MFIPLVLLASVGVGLLRGGRIENLLLLRPRYLPLFFIPLLLQVVAFSSLGDVVVLDSPLARFMYSLSLGFAAVALFLNRHLPGVTWISAGLFLNFLVIVLNGGFMPISAEARAYAGLAPVTDRDLNIIPMTERTVLPWLADIFPLPRGIPFATVFSIGDIFVALGGIVFIQSSLLRPVVRPPEIQKATRPEEENETA
jgi:hypothetical protein